MKFSGNIPGQDLIWMEVENTEGGTAERGNLRFHSTNGQEIGINANGIYGNQPLHWNGGNFNVNEGSLYVNGDISYTGNLGQTSSPYKMHLKLSCSLLPKHIITGETAIITA